MAYPPGRSASTKSPPQFAGLTLVCTVTFKSLHRNVQAGSQQICGVRKFRQNIDHLCLAIELIASTYDPAYVREFTAVREYERDITLLIGLLGGFQEFDALDINVEKEFDTPRGSGSAE